jgi:WhiB family redox-sensing transcriptional regulator
MTRRRKTPAPVPLPVVDLLAAILRDTPRLQGARCRTHPEVFDATHPIGRGACSTRHHVDARAAAVAVCQRCPALPACRAWLESLPASQRPSGIVAGQLTTTKGTETP